MANETTYPAAFAGPRRDGALAVTTSAAGEHAWRREHGAELGSRPALLVLEGNPLVVGSNEIVLFNPKGERGWTRRRHTSSPVACANGAAYYETRDFGLDAVSPTNADVLKGAPLAGVLNDEYLLSLFWAGDKEFVLAAYVADPKYDSEGGEQALPRVLTARAEYGQNVGEWGDELEGLLELPPLFLPEQQRLVIAMNSGVSVLNVKDGPATKFKLPVERASEWSATANGQLRVAGEVQGRPVLVALDLAGERIWQWASPVAGASWLKTQPPVSVGPERTYAFTESRVLAFDKGEPAWAYDTRFAQKLPRPEVPATAKPGRYVEDAVRFATGLADGSLLVAAGDRLRKLDRSGESVFDLSLDETIAAPPVVDAQGSIYVLTTRQLHRLK